MEALSTRRAVNRQTFPDPSLAPLQKLVESHMQLVDQLIIHRVQSEVPLITDLARHIIASGGKRIRPALTLASAALCGYQGQEHIALAAAIEFIHTATLLHDDVVDESKLRRGLATANEVFGNKASVLVSVFLLSQAFQMMVEHGSLKVLKILADTSAIIAKGEVMQLMTTNEPATTEEQYIAVVSSKTAILFAAACELGAIAAGEDEHEKRMHDFGNYLGIAFQLVDDALDYAADQEKLGKSVGDDFREGKITLPVILAYARGDAEERQFWTRCLGDLEQQEGDLAHAQKLMEGHGCIQETLARAAQYAEKALLSIDIFEESAQKRALQEAVAFCVNRAY